MLKSSLALTIMRAVTALRSTGQAAHATLADALDTALRDDMATRASVAAGQAKRSTGRPGRNPAIAYTVEVEPGGIACAMGSKAAHALLVDALAKLGSGAACPSAGSLAAILSGRGQWLRIVDTMDGTVAVTVRKATPAEVARLLA